VKNFSGKSVGEIETFYGRPPALNEGAGNHPAPRLVLRKNNQRPIRDQMKNSARSAGFSPLY
jgi:hypothetical protein